MIDYIRLLRPTQWLKNVFVFAGLIFSRQFLNVDSIEKSIFAFVVFSILSSSGYIINDILDYKEDKAHPVKSKRPIAAGKVHRGLAALIAVFLFVLSLVGAYLLGNHFLYVCLIYSGLMISYSVGIKNLVILDVLFVAVGYVLRAIAGAVVIAVEISSWLLLCTLLIALFLVISKRRTEIVLLGEGATKHRKILSQYSLGLLNQMIAIVTAACIVAYCLYTLAPETVNKFGTRNLIYTIPFVIYGIFRYLYITFQKVETDIPERVLISDLPLQLCLLAWFVTCVLILSSV
ncbi:MAG: decaprenyl-phosphate phosphoribosyltransferase [bacterium]